MTITYLTVGIDRIQAHLARSRRLWGRRGASEELVRLTMLPGQAQKLGITDPLAISEVISREVEINPQGLDIDGVVSLQAVDETAGVAAAHKYARLIRRRLPATSVTVSWVTVDETTPYAQVITKEALARWQRVHYLPSAPEYPAVRTCDECRQAPASKAATRIQEDGELRLCDDCYARLGQVSSRGRTVVRPAQRYPIRFAAEWWLRDQLAAGGLDLRVVEDFEALGHLVRSRPDDEAKRTTRDNHIGLIFADGNAMGGLFKAATAKAAVVGDTRPVLDLSAAVKSATAAALESATREIVNETDTHLPVIPHIVGGDDVLVSVSADRAWPFLIEFLTALRRGLAGEDFAAARPSMSAGLVICKAEYPLANQVELAEALLSRAKRAVAGNGWSISWADITADGPTAPDDRVWTLDDFTNRSEGIKAAVALTANAASSLRAALASPTPALVAQRLEHLGARMPEIASFLTAVDLDLGALTAQNVRALQDVFSIRRWW